MPIKSPEPRRTMWDTFPQVTKLPKPWRLFVHQPWDGKAGYPKYGETVLCTDGNHIWAAKWFDQELHEDWRRCFAWCRLPKPPDLGLIWPSKVVLPRFNKKQLDVITQPVDTTAGDSTSQFTGLLVDDTDELDAP